MRDESLQFLENLANTPSPTGHETRGQRVWLDYVSHYADSTESDAYGNCVATLNRGGGPRLMLAAHADEIAMSVNYITPEGFIHVRKMGGIDAAIIKAQRVTIHSKKGDILGIVGNVAPHLMRAEGEPKPPKIHELFIDIGAKDRAHALKIVRIGDPITLNDRFELLRGKLAVARAFDNRIGTWAVAEAVRRLQPHIKKLKVEICAVSNIQEEVGLLGARQIAYSLHPSAALVVDVTHATDYPSVDLRQHGDIRLGHGPALTHGGPNHPEMVKRLESVADKMKIPIQHEAMSNNSGTDADVIFWTRGGIPSALVSLPLRYMHSPVETLHLEDLDQIADLLSGFALSLKQDEKFKVVIP